MINNLDRIVIRDESGDLTDTSRIRLRDRCLDVLEKRGSVEKIVLKIGFERSVAGGWEYRVKSAALLLGRSLIVSIEHTANLMEACDRAMKRLDRCIRDRETFSKEPCWRPDVRESTLETIV